MEWELSIYWLKQLMVVVKVYFYKEVGMNRDAVEFIEKLSGSKMCPKCNSLDTFHKETPFMQTKQEYMGLYACRQCGVDFGFKNEKAKYMDIEWATSPLIVSFPKKPRLNNWENDLMII